MRHFTLAELTRTDSGLDNTPSLEQVVAIVTLVATVLDPLREHLGIPVHPTSGVRVLAVNRHVKSDDTSQHVKGEAADIKVSGFTPAQLARTILDLRLPFDQLIWYEEGHGKPSVHVSHTTRRANRGEVLHWVPTEPHYLREMP